MSRALLEEADLGGPQCPLVVPVCPPREKGQKERETLQQMAEVTREGFRLKKILIEDWKKAREEKQVRGPGADPGPSGGRGWRGLAGFTFASCQWCPGASDYLCLSLLICPLGI